MNDLLDYLFGAGPDMSYMWDGTLDVTENTDE